MRVISRFGLVAILLILAVSSASAADANCPLTYSGPDTGSWRVECWDAGTNPNEFELYGDIRKKGVEYALDNVDRWPAVVTARLARTWGLRGSDAGDGFDNSSPALEDAERAKVLGLVAGFCIAETSVAAQLVHCALVFVAGLVRAWIVIGEAVRAAVKTCRTFPSTLRCCTCSALPRRASWSRA